MFDGKRYAIEILSGKTLRFLGGFALRKHPWGFSTVRYGRATCTDYRQNHPQRAANHSEKLRLGMRS
jgi:hypothetical protein